MLNLKFDPFPVLYTERLVLRNVSKNDAGSIFKLRSDKKIMQFIDRPMATTEKDALNYIGVIALALQNKSGITWAISLKDDPALIGTIGFWRIESEHYRAEIGYMLHTDFHSKGITNEAMKVVLNYGFSVMQLHSVEANIKPGNIASMKLLEKNGFVQEAYFKENYFFNGEFFDSAVYSLLVQNFKL
ncbi:MAG TPA: GNAT family N-acetyltransferase [Parafilimonas sp.]|nr:GNAT family N-acetyltransferase [Parafilimonas sp.]